MRVTGYDRYNEQIANLRAKGYRIKDKDIKTKDMYELSVEAHNTFDKFKSKNMPRDMARRAVTLSPKQIKYLQKRHPGLKHSEMRGLGLSDMNLMIHDPDLTIEELRNLTPEEIQARKDAIKALRREEGYSAQYGS